MKLRDGVSFEKAKNVITDAKISLGNGSTLRFNDYDKTGDYTVAPWAILKMYFYAKSGLGEKRQNKVREIFNTIFPMNFSDFDTAMENTGVLEEVRNSRSRNSDYYERRLKGLRYGYADRKKSQDTLNKILEYLHIAKDTTDIFKFLGGGYGISNPVDIEEEAAEIEQGLDGLGETEKDQVIKARLGQSDFRNRVLELYKRKCVVTNVEEREDGAGILIASHIRAWSDCTDANEKLDEHNALLLAPHIDKLFDKHLISFEDDGTIIASDEIKDILKKWGVTIEKIKAPFSEKTKGYLKFHRDKSGL